MNRRVQFLLKSLLYFFGLLLCFALVGPFFKDSFSFERFVVAIQDKETFEIFLFTLKHAAFAVVISHLIAVGLNYLSDRFKFSLSGLRIAVVLPSFVPVMVVVMLMKMLSTDAPYSMVSVVLAWVMVGSAYLAYGLEQARYDLNPKLKEMLLSLGLSPVRAFFKHDLALTWSSQRTLVLHQLFLNLTSFSIVAILSGGPPNETLELALFNSFQLGSMGRERTLALAFVLGALLILIRAVSSRGSTLNRGSPGARFTHLFLASERKGWGLRFFGVALLLMSWPLYFIFTPAFRVEFVLRLLSGIGYSCLLAALVAFLSLLLFVLSYLSNLRFLTRIGLWLSPLALSLLWWQAYSFSINSFFNAAIVQALFFLPFLSEMLYPLLDQARRAEVEAVQSLGLPPVSAWMRVEWPRIRGPVQKSIGLLLALSLAEVTTVLLFSRGEFETISVMIQDSFMRFQIEESVAGTFVLLGAQALILFFSHRRWGTP